VQNYYNMLTEKELESVLILAENLQSGPKASENNAFADRLEPILESPDSKHFLIRLMDVAFRSKNNRRVSDYVLNLFKTEDTHKGLFSAFESFLVALYRSIGHYFPAISIPLMLKQIKEVTGPILFFVGDRKFAKQAESRSHEGIKLNVNLIGEALIGEKEAAQRIKEYCELLRQPNVDYISIKISTIYSQITTLAHEHSVQILVEKLSVIFDELLAIHKETGVWKFVNLDMEEYRDLQMTLDIFKQTLSKEKYKTLKAGIVLQAYLPDSYTEIVKLQAWAKNRTDNGGSPVKVRLVKGANMEMEKTEASMEDWEVASYTDKIDTDANFKKILLFLLHQEKLEALNLGIASHNIFDLAFALHIVKQENLNRWVDFEMLEGMANDTVKALLQEEAKILLYTPIVEKENYNSAIAYLVRRLDEGTQDGNFLKEGFGLHVGSPKWNELKNQFLHSINAIPSVKEGPLRIQNRLTETFKEQISFRCVPNTDWTLEHNRKWMNQEIQAWEAKQLTSIPVISFLEETKHRKHVQIAGWNGLPKWNYELADDKDYLDFLNANDDWYLKPSSERAMLLRKAAVELEKKRGELTSVAVSELGKTIAELDVEISEAIDFANYYAASILELEPEVSFDAKQGVNLILSPWNFPIAIPIGGVLASLAAGKRVILKPSTNAAATAYLTSCCLWEAGISKSAFAFLPTEEKILDQFLSTGNTFDAVILTGGTDTAQFLLERNLFLNLHAETGGKNSTIITALSDREQAVKNVVQSAFGNAGQKCSATSLLILEEEVFNDVSFKNLLKDAASSKSHGDPWKYETQIGPMALPVSAKIKAVLKNTKEEDWLLKPVLKGEFFLSPGIKWGVTKDDFEYNNELFGPILSVMKASNLRHAIELANGVDYGLTSGIESLDKNEVALWKSEIMAGNLYANRATTGAIVQRQPFGGMKASNFGFGMKAGGLNYVLQFMHPSKSEVSFNDAKKSFIKWNEELFEKEIDYAKIRGQHNLNRYLKPKKVIVLVDSKTPQIEIDLVKLAMTTLDLDHEFISLSNETVNAIETRKLGNWDEIISDINHQTVIRSIMRGTSTETLASICHKKAIHIYEGQANPNGRVELLKYLTEQNFSFNFHRYGNLLGEV
jgi:RHH-type proline utilization regulon transcriptional repressor/proline dehydrogenase/delta 1-pyrroline-5-carboxylate dehydrogenase